MRTIACGFALVLSACGPRTAGRVPLSASSAAVATNALTLGDGQFLAVSVANLDVSRRWYQTMFALSPLLDSTSPDSAVHTVVLGSDALVVELSAHRTARSLRDYAGAPTPTFLVHGFFKGGLFVSDLDSAATVLRRRGASTLSEARADSVSRLRFMFLRDPDGNYLQLLERARPE